MTTGAGESFARLAAEMRLLDEEAAAIEPALSGLGRGGDDFARLQNFDRLRQHIQALTTVLERLRDAAAAGAPVCLESASEQVSLEDVRQRLAGGAAVAPRRGEVDLFES